MALRLRHLLSKLFQTVPDRGVEDDVPHSQHYPAEDVGIDLGGHLHLAVDLFADFVAQALDLAHSTCGVLSGGGTAADALSKIAGATNWSNDQATNFGIAAVVAYCKDMMSVATAV